MKNINEIILPENCKYTHEHIWIRAEGDVYYVGVSDFAQDQLGEVVYVDLPSEGNFFQTNASFGEVESIKSVNKLFMPVDGEIVAINNALDEMPTLINSSCYEKAWVAQIRVKDVDSISALMNAEDYRTFLQK